MRIISQGNDLDICYENIAIYRVANILYAHTNSGVKFLLGEYSDLDEVMDVFSSLSQTQNKKIFYMPRKGFLYGNN